VAYLKFDIESKNRVMPKLLLFGNFGCVTLCLHAAAAYCLVKAIGMTPFHAAVAA